MHYGELISNMRLYRNMSLREFETLTGVSYGYIRKLEQESRVINGKKLSPSIDILKQICDKCDYPFDKFLKEAGYIENDNSVSEDEYRLLHIYREMNEECKKILIAYAETVHNMNNKK